MPNPLKAAFDRLDVYLMRRRQHDNLRLRKHFREKHGVDVGLYSYGCFDPWRMPGPLRIGRYCSFANTVRSATVNHPIDAITTHPVLYEKKFGVVDHDIQKDQVLVVEDDVWVGHYAIILPGCKHIGRGAIIGAGAIVTKDVEPYTIVAGNPAKKLRDRFDPQLVAAIEESRWWELDPNKLRTLVADRREMIFHPTATSVTAWNRDCVR
jgi:acetyltransferase-like isoleucine patch superfamily enzyme